MSVLTQPDEVKSFVRARADRCEKVDRGCGRYSFDAGGLEALAASCDAAPALYVTDQLPDDPQWLRDWTEYVNEFQDPQTGQYLSDDTSRMYAGKGRMPAWLFGMVVRALNALGGQPRHPLSFLAEWAARDDLRQSSAS